MQQGPNNQHILKKAEDVELLRAANPKYTYVPVDLDYDPRSAVTWKLALWLRPRSTTGNCRMGTSARWTAKSTQAFKRAHHVVCDHRVIWEVFIRQGRTSEQVLRRGGRARTFSLQNGWYFAEKDVRALTKFSLLLLVNHSAVEWQDAHGVGPPGLPAGVARG